jgi:hypothetical protein
VPAVKIRPDEMEIVKQAASRIERRSNSRFVIDRSRVEVTDEEGRPSPDIEDDESKPTIVCE